MQIEPITQEEKFVLRTLYRAEKYKRDGNLPDIAQLEIDKVLTDKIITEDKIYVLESKYSFATEKFVLIGHTTYVWDLWSYDCYILKKWGKEQDFEFLLREAREMVKNKIIFKSTEAIAEHRKAIEMITLYLQNVDYYVKYMEQKGHLQYIDDIF